MTDKKRSISTWLSKVRLWKLNLKVENTVYAINRSSQVFIILVSATVCTMYLWLVGIARWRVVALLPQRGPVLYLQCKSRHRTKFLIIHTVHTCAMSITYMSIIIFIIITMWCSYWNNNFPVWNLQVDLSDWKRSRGSTYTVHVTGVHFQLWAQNACLAGTFKSFFTIPKHSHKVRKSTQFQILVMKGYSLSIGIVQLYYCKSGNYWAWKIGEEYFEACGTCSFV